MKAKILLLILVSGIISGAMGQNTVDLTFTAVDSAAYVQLDSIKVMNRTQGGDTVLYWPDTVLSIYYVGIPEISKVENSFQVFQNYPNPVADQTTISLYIPDNDRVSLVITDIMGRLILQSERILEKGNHSFRFTPGAGSLYFFTARWREKSSSINILQVGFQAGKKSSLEYLGIESSSPQLKAVRAIQSFFYSPGDELLYIGYADMLQSGILDFPEESQTYTFQFATNIPCPGMPSVEYEGQVYNTIQIFSQCWLKENLNVGTMINGSLEQTNNGIIEKYCYGNNTANCDIYGGLYQWNEMMGYSITPGVQGICPPGWHIPTDEEWKVLDGAVDSYYGIGDIFWDSLGFRGYDAGTNLKTKSGWQANGNGTDLFGFSGVPGGGRNDFGLFGYIGYRGGGGWSSTERDSYYAWRRVLFYNSPGVYRNYENNKDFGIPVRCLRDY